jgi:hypothetical protein
MWNLSMHASHTLIRISVLALCALPMRGQTGNTGAIAGSVSDPSGALLASAALIVKSHRGRARCHHGCRGKFLGPIPDAWQL